MFLNFYLITRLINLKLSTLSVLGPLGGVCGGRFLPKCFTLRPYFSFLATPMLRDHIRKCSSRVHKFAVRCVHDFAGCSLDVLRWIGKINARAGIGISQYPTF